MRGTAVITALLDKKETAHPEQRTKLILCKFASILK
jgi:hypothetical protein